MDDIMNEGNMRKERKELKLLMWNVEGLLEKLTDDDFCEYIYNFDIVCFCETFTFPNFDFRMKFNEYNFVHNAATKFTRMGRPSGGVILLIKKEIEEYVKIIETNLPNILCAEVQKSWLDRDKDTLIIGTYIHPVGSIFYTDKDFDCTLDLVEQLLTDHIDKDKDYEYIIGGDMNARIGDWSYSEKIEDILEEDEEAIYTRRAKDRTINGFGKRLIELCSTFNLTPLNGLEERNFDDNFTFYSTRGNSTIDHYICTTGLLDSVTEFSIESRIEAQHMPISVSLSTTSEKQQKQKHKETYVRKIIWDEAKKGKYLEHLASEEMKERLEKIEEDIDTNIDTSIDNFYSILKEAGKEMTHSIKIGGIDKKKKGWFDKECSTKKKLARTTLNKLTKTSKEKEPIRYEELKKEYMERRLEYQKTTREKKRQFKKNTYDSLIKDKKDSKKFWRTIKTVNYKKIKHAEISAEEWQKYFSELLDPIRRDSKQTAHPQNNTLDQTDTATRNRVEIDQLDTDITEEEVSIAISKLKDGKSPGIDGIPAEFLKTAEYNIKYYLTSLFNKIYQSSYFPIAWARSIIVPIYKKGDKAKPENYRGISLLSIVSKIFTSILNKRLYNWAEDGNKIGREQAGFRRNHSTIDHIYTLTSMISNCLYGRRRSKLYIAFIDYKKAFDTVKREILWEILTKHNISTKMLNMIQGIYETVQAQVRHGRETTEFFECPLGVRQGCQLSPLLFSLFITEIAERIGANGRSGYQFRPGTEEIYSLLFADDIALVARTPSGLQNQLNNLKTASERIGLTINLNKTKVMVFRKGGFLGKAEKWFYGKEKIEVVNSYKYLGYTLTTKLSTDIALAEFAGRAKGKVLDLIKTMQRLGHIDINIFFKLFDAQVKPMLLYAAEIWGTTSYKAVENVHLFACKKILGVSKNTPNNLVYGELGRYPLYVDSVVRTVKYWLKILELPQERLPRLAYEKEKTELNKTLGWGKNVKHWLETNGYAQVWMNQGVHNVNSFLRSFKQRLIDVFKQTWHDKISNSERFRTYNSFKDTHLKELYLTEITIAKFRKAFTRFRFGVAGLNGSKEYTDQLAITTCAFCPGKETENHFLLECPTYDDLRSKYLYKYWNTNRITITDIIQTGEVEKMRNLSMYIHHALIKREQQM